MDSENSTITPSPLSLSLAHARDHTDTETHPPRPHRDSHGVLHTKRSGAVSLVLHVGVFIREKVCDSAEATGKNAMITELLVILYI